MAQLNPNFEIDFSDINSYEQIQLINDTQLARENLLMHRAYREPSDDEVIRNKFSSFTFVDFCPKVFTQHAKRTPSSSTLSLAKMKITSGEPSTSSSGSHTGYLFGSGHDRPRPHYELESFSDLFERINVWLKLNKDWQVVSMETLMFDCSSQFNHTRSSINCNFMPRNTRGLRLYLSPSKSRFAGAQKIGCINVVPRKLQGSHIASDNEPVEYENLDQILHRLNEILLMRPIEGRILSVETITLPMKDGYVNTEANYFVDSRLNMVSQYVYLGGSSSGESSSVTDSQQGHCLVDILRVYYEFGPTVCGLVNIIDFVPKFYSPTTTLDHLAATTDSQKTPHSSRPNSPEVSPQDDATTTATATTDMMQPTATEALTRLIRRSLAWFEAERKLMLNPGSGEPRRSSDDNDTGTESSNKDEQLPAARQSSIPAVDLKLCNLRIQHKTLLESKLRDLNATNSLDIINTRQMVHTRQTVLESCSAVAPPSPPLEHSEAQGEHAERPKTTAIQADIPHDLKFIRLAYVIPIFGTSKRKFKASKAAAKRQGDKCKKAPTGDVAPPEIPMTPPASPMDVQELAKIETSPSSNADPTSSLIPPEVPSRSPVSSCPPSPTLSNSGSCSSSRSSSSSSSSSSASSDFSSSQPLQKQHQLQQHQQHHVDPQEQDYDIVRAAYLRILDQTNSRHQTYELEHQAGQSNYLDDRLDESPIGQLTYRLFAPCQLVQSSSCFAINPVNSSSPLSRRGSVGINSGGSPGGLSSDQANSSSTLLLASSGGGQSATGAIAKSLGLDSFGALFPSISHADLFAPGHDNYPRPPLFAPIREDPNANDDGRHEIQPQDSPLGASGSGSRFSTNEFEPVEAIKRRMQVYVTTNSMKVLAGETHIVNLSSYRSCLSTAIEQTLVKSTSIAQSRPSTWVGVYVIYAAVDEPHVPSQLIVANQAKMRELNLINEQQQHQQQLEDGSKVAQPEIAQQLAAGEQQPQSVVDTSPMTTYNSAYERTVALPSEPENHSSFVSQGNLDETFEGADCPTGCPATPSWETFGPETRAANQPQPRKHKRRRHRIRIDDSQCSLI